MSLFSFFRSLFTSAEPEVAEVEVVRTPRTPIQFASLNPGEKFYPDPSFPADYLKTRVSQANRYYRKHHREFALVGDDILEQPYIIRLL